MNVSPEYSGRWSCLPEIAFSTSLSTKLSYSFVKEAHTNSCKSIFLMTSTTELDADPRFSFHAANRVVVQSSGKNQFSINLVRCRCSVSIHLSTLCAAVSRREWKQSRPIFYKWHHFFLVFHSSTIQAQYLLFTRILLFFERNLTWHAASSMGNSLHGFMSSFIVMVCPRQSQSLWRSSPLQKSLSAYMSSSDRFQSYRVLLHTFLLELLFPTVGQYSVCMCPICKQSHSQKSAASIDHTLCLEETVWLKFEHRYV